MVFRLLGKLVWGVAKLIVRFIVIPILISAAIAALLAKVSDKMREGSPHHDGHVDPVIKPDR